MNYQVWIRRLNPFHYYRMWCIRRIIRRLPPMDRSAYEGNVGEYINIINGLVLPPRVERGSEANQLRVLQVTEALNKARRKT